MYPAPPDDQSAQAVEDFYTLRQILQTFRRERACLRSAEYVSHRIMKFVAPGVRITRGVVRDNAVCALANKGCNTHASVRTLTDAGNGDDATVTHVTGIDPIRSGRECYLCARNKLSP